MEVILRFWLKEAGFPGCRLALTVLLAATVSGCITGYIDRKTGITDTRALQASGVPAQATVVSISDSGMTLNQDPVVDFVLEVKDQDGGQPYRATTRSPISRLDVPRFQPGAVVPVKVDPHNPSHVALDVYKYKR